MCPHQRYLSAVFLKWSIFGPLPLHPRIRFRFYLHQNVVILLIAIPPINLEAADTANQFRLRFQNHIYLLEKNMAGYMAIRCIPLVISSLALSLIASFIVTPFPAPFIISFHFPLSCAIPGSLNCQKDAFSRIRSATDESMDGQTDGPMDGPTVGQTNGLTDRPSYRDAMTHLKNS